MRMQWRTRLALLMMIGLLGAFAPAASIHAAPAADIEGNTYTSPTFGYSVTWDDTWFVTAEETRGGADYLGLVNGVTSAVFGGLPDASSATTCLAYLVNAIGPAAAIGNLTALVGDDGNVVRGEEGNHAYAAFSGTATIDGDITIDVALYLDCQPIVPGESLLTLGAIMPLLAFDGQLPLIRELLAGVVMPGALQDDSTDPEDGPAAEEVAPDAEFELGEPAPVFVTGRWRVAVATTVRDREIEAAGLEAKAGKEWIVVVADVTNWSDERATFSGDSLGLVFAGDDRRYEVAPNSSRAVARALDLAVTELEAGVRLDPDETARVALVFQVPAEGDGPTLQGHGDEPGLPIEDDLGTEDLLEIGPPAEPPVLQVVEVVEAIDGEVVELRLAGERAIVRARLIGVDAPADGDCYADLAASGLAALDSETAWIELDPAEAGGLTERVYLWTDGPDGTRVLVNERQVADGYAKARPLDEETRFGAWIGEAGRTAEASGNGLWGNCEQDERTAPTETAGTERDETLPDDVTIRVDDQGYRPEQVTVPAETDVTLTIANVGTGEHTFTIDELDVNIAIPPGESETFTISVPAGDYVFYCQQPGHRAAGMEGVLHAE